MTTTPELTTEEVSKLTHDEKALQVFTACIAEEEARIAKRKTQMNATIANNPTDPNLEYDRDFIAQREALIRGYRDAAAGAKTRGAKARAEKDARAAVGARPPAAV